MNKEEILSRNKRYNKNEEDEREEYISAKAGINAKIVFSLVIVFLAFFKHYNGIFTGDIWGIFTAYAATESFYKYHYLRHTKFLISGILFSVSSAALLLQFIISTWR